MREDSNAHSDALILGGINYLSSRFDIAMGMDVTGYAFDAYPDTPLRIRMILYDFLDRWLNQQIGNFRISDGAGDMKDVVIYHIITDEEILEKIDNATADIPDIVSSA